MNAYTPNQGKENTQKSSPMEPQKYTGKYQAYKPTSSSLIQLNKSQSKDYTLQKSPNQEVRNNNNSYMGSRYADGQNPYEVPTNDEGVPIRRRPQIKEDNFKFKYIAPNRDARRNFGIK